MINPWRDPLGSFAQPREDITPEMIAAIYQAAAETIRTNGYHAYDRSDYNDQPDGNGHPYSMESALFLAISAANGTDNDLADAVDTRLGGSLLATGQIPFMRTSYGASQFGYVWDELQKSHGGISHGNQGEYGPGECPAVMVLEAAAAFMLTFKCVHQHISWHGSRAECQDCGENIAIQGWTTDGRPITEG
jgi:hypothetical protein